MEVLEAVNGASRVVELAELLAISGGIRPEKTLGDGGDETRALYAVGCILCLIVFMWWCADAGHRSGFGDTDDG